MSSSRGWSGERHRAGRGPGQALRPDVAVAGVDLAVEPGEIFGLVGPNGAGKTTTLRILATLLEPSAGEAEICGYSVTRNPDEVRRVLGFMPDRSASTTT